MEKPTITGADWTGASTLEECIVRHFERRTTDSDDFKKLLAGFGRDKIAKFWEAWTERKKHASQNYQEKVQSPADSRRVG